MRLLLLIAAVSLSGCGSNPELSERLMRAGAALQGGGASSAGSGSGGTCFSRGEATSGFYKNCVYDCLGGQVVRTVASTDLCPITIGEP